VLEVTDSQNKDTLLANLRPGRCEAVVHFKSPERLQPPHSYEQSAFLVLLPPRPDAQTNMTKYSEGNV
jgi:hypothetical protein